MSWNTSVFALITHCVCLENENVVLTTLNCNFVPNSHFEEIISQRRRLNASQDVQGRCSVEKKKTWRLKLIDEEFSLFHENTWVKMHMIDLFIVPLGPKFTGNFCSNTRGF